MSPKMKSFIRAFAVILVALAVLMELNFVIIPSIDPYRFWLVVFAFGLLLITK